MAEIHEFAKTIPFTIADAILGTNGAMQAIGKEFDISFDFVKKEHKDLKKEKVDFKQNVQPLYKQIKESSDKLEKQFEISEHEKDIYPDRYSEKNASSEEVTQKSLDFNEADDINFQAAREVANSMQQNLQMMEASLSDIENKEFDDLRKTIDKLIGINDRILALDETLSKQDYEYYTVLMKQYDTQLSLLKKSSEKNKEIASTLQKIEEESGRNVQKETMDSVIRKHGLTMDKFQKGLEKHYDGIFGSATVNETAKVGLSGITGIIGDMFGVSGLGALGPAIFEAFDKNPSDLIKASLQKIGILKKDEYSEENLNDIDDIENEDEDWGDGTPASTLNNTYSEDEEEEDWGYDAVEKLGDIETELEAANSKLSAIAGLTEEEVNSIDDDKRSDSQLLAEIKSGNEQEKELNYSMSELIEVEQDLLAQAQDDREEQDWQFKQHMKQLGKNAKESSGGFLGILGGKGGKLATLGKFVKPALGLTAGAAAIFGMSKLGGKIGGELGGEKGELVGETIGKTGTRVAAVTAEKAIAKKAAKTAGKSVTKKIPIVGALAGVGFSVGRFKEGDVLGGIGEIASGLASIIPGFGTAASIAIDGALLAKDLVKSGEDVVESADKAISDISKNATKITDDNKNSFRYTDEGISYTGGDISYKDAMALANLPIDEKSIPSTIFESSRIENMQTMPAEMRLARPVSEPGKGSIDYANNSSYINRDEEIVRVSANSPYKEEYVDANIVLPVGTVDNSLVYEEVEKERLLKTQTQTEVKTTSTTQQSLPTQNESSPTDFKPDDIYLTLIAMKAFTGRT